LTGKRSEPPVRRLDEGFEAVKLRITDRSDLAAVREVRETFPDLPLMVDANKGWAVRVVESETRWSVKSIRVNLGDVPKFG